MRRRVVEWPSVARLRDVARSVGPRRRSPVRAFWVVDSFFLGDGSADRWFRSRSHRLDVRRVSGRRWVVERFASPPLRAAVRRVEFLRRGLSPFFWVVDSFVADTALGRYRSIGPGTAVARAILVGWQRCSP